jgi:hypothetical protein
MRFLLSGDIRPDVYPGGSRSFRSVFIALTIGFAFILGAFLVQRARPRVETDQPNADFVKATGKCAECHSRQQYSIVHEYEMSKHAAKGCLDCHQPQKGQDADRQDRTVSFAGPSGFQSSAAPSPWAFSGSTFCTNRREATPSGAWQFWFCK